MTALVRGGTVLPHVQRFADAVSKATGADSFGTYAGHDPSIERALDIFVPTTSRDLGDAIAAFAIANLDRFGVWYLIYRQRIYNPKIATYWRAMEDRGSPTANHMDHVHVSFEATAAPVPDPDPVIPTPTPKEPDVSKVAYPLSVDAGERRRLPVLAIGGGFGWARASVTFASTGVDVRRAVVGPNVRPIDHLSPSGVESTHHFDGRWYVDLVAGDEWIEVELDAANGGTLDLYVEASD